jgi:hypothetical protein
VTSSSIIGQSSRRALMFVCLFLVATGAALADTLWTRTYASPWYGDDAACTVLPDRFNNTTVVGTGGHYPGIGGSDIVVIKYSLQQGNLLWTRRITGGDWIHNVAMAAAIRLAGSVCVTGQIGKAPNYDILTLQLDPNGNEVWRATYDGIKHAADLGTAIATDSEENVFVAGQAQNTTLDYITMKYYWDGTRAWATLYDGGGNDRPTALALGPDGSVYVTGNSGTVKYSPSGVQQWVRDSGIARATALVVDESGSVYVTGSVPAPNMTSYLATVKYDSAGTQQWASVYAYPQGQGVALALGASALYVAGMAEGATGDVDCMTIAHDCATGDTIWVRRDSGPNHSYDAAVGVAVGSDSSIWVTGSSNKQFMTVLYTPDGVEHWVERYGISEDDGAVAIALDRENKVVVTGNTWENPGYDILTVKFDTIGMAVAEPPDVKPLPDFRFEVTPNPSASGKVTLRFNPGIDGAASVTVSGVDGRVVLTRSIETNGTYALNLGRLDAGVYIVRLVSGGRAATQKLVIGQ